MENRRSLVSQAWIPIGGVYTAGFLLQVTLVVYFMTHLDAAILRLMPDDAFYYLKIAENIANGLGSVFSPGEPANGYHPLWMSILVALHWAARPSPTGFIAIALVASIFFNLMAAELLRRYCLQLGFQPEQALLGAVLYLFSPWTVYLTLTGLETPLFIACLLAFLLVTQRLLDASTTPTVRQAAWFGVASGLLMLARTDSIFFTAPAFLWLWARYGRRSLAPLLAAGLLSCAVLAPWLLWNYLSFGTIAQSSSSAIALLHHFRHPDPWTWDYWRYALENYTNSTYWAAAHPLISHPVFAMHWPWWPWAVRLLTIFVVGVAFLYWRLGRPLRLPALFFFPAAALVFFYCAVRLFIQVWHLSPLYPLVIIYLLNFAPGVRLRHVALAVLLLLPLTVYAARNAYVRPQEQEGRVAYFQELWPQKDAPDGQKVCITDAGMPGYFARRHEVVNLDGLVNLNAFAAIQAGRFSEYTAAIGCDSVILDKSRLEYYDRNLPK